MKVETRVEYMSKARGEGEAKTRRDEVRKCGTSGRVRTEEVEISNSFLR